MLPIVLLTLAWPSRQTIDAALAAHTAMRSGGATIVRTSGKQRQTITVDWQRPGRVVARMTTDTGNQVLAIDGKQVALYNPALGEYIVSQRGLSDLDPMVRMVVDDAEMKRFLAPFRQQSLPLRRIGSAMRIGSSVYSLQFDARTRRLTTVLAPPDRITITYRAAKTPVTFVPPKGAVRVQAFSPSVQLPHFTDRQAELVVKKMLSAYRARTQGVVSIVSDEGSERIAYSGQRFRQTSTGGRWAYDGKTLWFVRGGVQRQTVRRGALLDTLSTLKLPVAPFLRAVIVRQSPFAGFLSVRWKASIGGNVTMNGTPCTIVNLTSSDSRVALFVRNDGLVQSTSVDLMGPQGVLSSSIRRFIYAPLSPGERFDFR